LILRHAFIPPDNARLANLSGSLDEHLRTLAAAFDVKIQRRNESFRVEGARANAERAVGLLQQLYGRAVRPIGGDELELAILEAMADDGARAETAGRNGAAAPIPGEPAPSAGPDLRLRTRRSDLAGRTPNQVAYLKNILGHDITFGIGPAGTGKTYSRWPAPSTRSSAMRYSASSSRARRSGPASASASCPATWRRRSTPTCARSTTRSTS
jgi:phosphate starvation-inducible PhoH-like protein